MRIATFFSCPAVVRTANIAVDILGSSLIVDHPSNPEIPEKRIFIRKPIPPMAITPRKHIFIDSHSSVLPGFLASFSNLDADSKNDFSPKVPRTVQNQILICKVIPEGNLF